MHIETFFDTNTSTFTYVVVDQATRKCAIIDSVMDYDLNSGIVSTEGADAVINYIQQNNLQNVWIIETHIHADHVSAADYLKKRVGGQTGIGCHISKVLEFWVNIFETEIDTPLTGEQFDQLFKDGDTFNIGNLEVKVIHTPGHTPACVTYLIDDSVFVGDTLLSPQMGTARCDFPGGSAAILYNSIQKIYALPDHTKIYLCHDYPEDNQPPLSMLTIAESKQQNSMIRSETTPDEFIEIRESKDYDQEVPKLIIPAIQTNVRLGSFGEKSERGVQFIRVPINVLKQQLGKFNKVTSFYYFSGQITKEDLQLAKDAGIKSIYCHRPDHEEAQQPTHEEIAQQAKALGLEFAYQPMTGDSMNDVAVKEFKETYDKLPKPILGYCRSGNRSLIIWKKSKGRA